MGATFGEEVWKERMLTVVESDVGDGTDVEALDDSSTDGLEGKGGPGTVGKRAGGGRVALPGTESQ